ncbi:iron dicitrate transport regulator FecR [Caulobacter sp. CCUG 60055]|uniref:FecR family protein n=1 Tax=Caulobacter sp. CCUG 60055 TaxID=2100090 RepID=UPI001FA71472|nr:FecR domain-containing protein [Caulobacter sp. CCUG 60055]MCI3180399.1 iron dicitrate transport regulator FecR [Caulobacter sp. CCUG 60055]
MGREYKEDRAQLIALASDWLVRLDAGDADAEDFERWRGADPRRAAAFAEVAATWGRLDDLRRAGGEPPSRFSTAERRARPAGLSRRALIGVGGAAAAGIAGVGAFAVRGDLLRPGLRTEIGERRQLNLPDGSAIELNTDTRVSWRFDRRERRLWLERGEAALTVAADEARPFLLMAAGTVARLRTGQFNARLATETLSLMVLAGQAAVDGPRGRASAAVERTDDRRRTLQAGPSGVSVAAVSEDSAQVVQAWRRGEIVFEGEPLSVAVGEYNRYLRRKLVIEDPAVGRIRLGGRFLTSDPEAFLTALGRAFGVRAVDSGDVRILLKSA